MPNGIGRDGLPRPSGHFVVGNDDDGRLHLPRSCFQTRAGPNHARMTGPAASLPASPATWTATVVTTCSLAMPASCTLSGAWLGCPDAGRVYLVPGGLLPEGKRISSSSLDTDSRSIWQGFGLGGSLSAIGDLDRDGYDEIAFARQREGAPWAPGGLFVVRGSAELGMRRRQPRRSCGPKNRPTWSSAATRPSWARLRNRLRGTASCHGRRL